MACLTFYRNNQPVMRHELKGTPVNIGREPANDVQLIEDDISKIHASIEWQNGSYILIDKSTNGTFVNDKKIDSHKLESGDIIVISGWRIKFDIDSKSSLRDTVVHDQNPTKVLKYESSKKEIILETLDLQINTPDGKKKEYKITKAAIGASGGNDIVISNDEYVSNNHCVIKSVGDNFVLEDLGSKNGTFLNNEKITRAVLSSKGEFVIGKTTIKFSTEQKSEKIKPTATTSLGPILGKSETIREIFSLIEKIAPSDVTACIIGESGTGKELFAHYIHEASQRHTKPFTALNCGAIPANLIESELFGHERGAFTSATSQHRGVFEQANGGTLFLDEIGEMPLNLQVRLLRVLEIKHIRRVGGQTDIPVDTRVLAATNKDLKTLVKNGQFREDLFFRLYVVPIEIPPLKKRKEDIQMLAEHFLLELLPEGKIKHLGNGALNKLLAYDWPGNVRELKNTIQRAIIISKETAITKENIIFSTISESEPQNLPLEEQERQSVASAIERSNGNISKAARQLGIARTTLISRLKKFEINADGVKIKKE